MIVRIRLYTGMTVWLYAVWLSFQFLNSMDGKEWWPKFSTVPEQTWISLLARNFFYAERSWVVFADFLQGALHNTASFPKLHECKDDFKHNTLPPYYLHKPNCSQSSNYCFLWPRGSLKGLYPGLWLLLFRMENNWQGIPTKYRSAWPLDEFKRLCKA